MEWLIASAQKVVSAAQVAVDAAEKAEDAAVGHLRSLLQEAQALLEGLKAHAGSSSNRFDGLSERG